MTFSGSRVRCLPLASLMVCSVLVGCGGFHGVVTPTLSSINPSTVSAGGAAFTLSVSGTDFTTGTQILWNGIAETTTVVSATQLSASITAAQIANAGTVSIRVMNSDTTTSPAMQLTIAGSTTSNFSLTSISPSSVAAGSPAFTLTATGTGFTAPDVIALNGSGVTTTFVSATQLEATVPAASVASPGVINVSVLGPNATSTNQLSLSITGASTGTAPTLTLLSPNSAFNNPIPLTLVAVGTGFVSGSNILWNGTALTTTFVSGTVLTAVVPNYDLAAASVAKVSVLNPGDSVSNTLPFTIAVSASTLPALTSLSPTEIAVGSPGFTLDLVGYNFAAGAIAYFGTDALPTTVVRDTELTAQVPASDLLAISTVQVTVQNPASAASNALPFGVGMTVYPGEVNDLVWDSAHSILYISSPATSTLHPNTVLAIDPLSLEVKYAYTAPAGGAPDRLAISSDAKYLYVGLDGNGTVERLLLPSLTPDIAIPLGTAPGLGPYVALDLEAAPGQPNTIAVAKGIAAPGSAMTAQGLVAIYDGTVERPAVITPQTAGMVLDSIQWGADASTLYAANSQNPTGDFYRLSVTANGAALVSDSPNDFPAPNQRIHYDVGSQMVYGEDGLAVNPLAATQVGNFISSGVMVPDSTIGNAYFVGQPSSDNGTFAYLVQSFNLKTFTPVASFSIPQIEGVPQHLIRWGSSGLAFNTKKTASCISTPCNPGDGRLYILNGPFVTQTAP